MAKKKVNVGWKRSKKSPPYPACCVGQIRCSYRFLLRLFGRPENVTEEPKISTAWVIENHKGVVLEIHDYKATSRYDERLLSVGQFRKVPCYTWDVSGKMSWQSHKIEERSMAAVGFLKDWLLTQAK